MVAANHASAYMTFMTFSRHYLSGDKHNGRRRFAFINMGPVRVKYVWDEDLEDRLIDLYEENEHLYNMRCAGYANRDKRKATMKRISLALDVPGKFFGA